jgi:hypothetical protein
VKAINDGGLLGYFALGIAVLVALGIVVSYF